MHANPLRNFFSATYTYGFRIFLFVNSQAYLAGKLKKQPHGHTNCVLYVLIIEVEIGVLNTKTIMSVFSREILTKQN